METKTYKSYRQLVAKLRTRGMVIGKGSQGSRVMRILEKENYYNVINGYKELFILTPATNATDEVYKCGTTFDEVYALYTFDREIRNIYLKYLLKIENSLKTVIAHEFSKLYGHDNYLKLDNFQSIASTDRGQLTYIAKRNKLDIVTDIAEINRISAEENASSVIKLIGDIHQEIARQMGKHHQVVTHYMTDHGYIPLWVLVNVLTFGKITNFFANMKPADKTTVARKFNVHPDELQKYMQILGLARNKCAHDERFYDFRSRRNIKTNSIKNISTLSLPKDNGNFVSGINDAFAVAIIISQLLKVSDVREFVTALKGSFNRLTKELHTISVDDVMHVMGFPLGWENLTKLK